jgi:hypothetical protein
MSKAHALPTGLGIENEGLELPLEELPEWEESKIKLYPIVSGTMARYSSSSLSSLVPVCKPDASVGRTQSRDNCTFKSIHAGRKSYMSSLSPPRQIARAHCTRMERS